MNVRYGESNTYFVVWGSKQGEMGLGSKDAIKNEETEKRASNENTKQGNNNKQSARKKSQ